jgi:hypothetical protein
MNSIFNDNAYNELIARLDVLNENSTKKWGKMTIGQMVWHCQLPLKIALENKKPKKRGSILAQIFFKKAMYNDKPWRKNLPTAPKLKAKEPKHFKEEIVELRRLVHQVHLLKDRKIWHPHPLFGTFTHEQWGQMQYKHLDHHFTQFGV